jgi:predicted dehydrogenase
MAEKIKWGILGTGKIAHKFAADLRLVQQAELRAVASRSIEKAARFGAEFHAVKYYGTYLELANDPEIDVVYIATPHVFHCENTLMCLKAGKSVLCEKPMGMNAHEVGAMIRESKSSNLFLMEALWTRFIPATEKLIEVIEKGVVGEITRLQSDFGYAAGYDPESRLFNKKLGGGALLDIGLYPVYLSLLLMGMPASIRASAILTKSGVDASCVIHFGYENGTQADLEATLQENTPIEALIKGTKGSIKMHKRFHHTEKLIVTEFGKSPKILNIPYRGNGYFHEIEEVISCIQNHEIQSLKMPHSMSMDLITTLDKIRQEIDLTYEGDDGE